MRPWRPWPQRLVGQVTLVLMLAVTLEFIGSSILFENSRLIRAAPWAVLLSSVGSAFILGLGVIAAAALVLRNLSRPLRSLAEAADKVGQGAHVRIAESGAGDLKLVAQAFNAMQDRIAGLLKTRTEALAAVGHDLRTPLARLRLRAGFVKDADAREALEADVDEMTAMLDSLLAYLGGQEDPEPRRRTDLAAIAMTLVDDATDAERLAVYAGLDHLPVLVRPIRLKRAISNVVENALHYGGGAALTLAREGDTAVLAVEDDGPGIPEDELASVLLPFHRLDSARARNTAGLGLGLTIVQQILHRENGSLVLKNRPQGGLRVELRLPAL
jgi:two-component system osmolarity sensor histidine kinase EnvZ